jgi:hypothetical protein
VGVEIVKAAVVCGRSLSGNAYKVLVSMSLQALDKPKDGRPAGLYFGGWAALQNALGYEEGGPDTKGHTAVKRAVRELRDGGHITPMVTAARGTRQSYLVHPGGINKGVSTDPKRGSLSDPKRGSESDPKGGHSATLLGHIEEGRGLTQDISIAHEPQPQTVDPKPEGHKFEGRPGDDCDACGRAYGNRRIHPLYLLRGGTA